MCSSWRFSRTFLRVLLGLASVISAAVSDDRPYLSLYSQDHLNKTVTENVADIVAGSFIFLTQGTEFMNSEPPDRTPNKYDGSTYDFVVVGAGTAGAAIAARLTEIPTVSVLLIEAGRSENLLMDIPMLSNLLQFSDDINWMYKTEPSNSSCLGMNNHQCNFPRGRVMGGSSVLNYMIATRGNKKDYDHWAEMGSDGWSWKDVLPYFKKLETMGIKELQGDTKNHNYDGPVHLNYARFRTPIATTFLKAGEELGYQTVDYNGETNTGFSYIQTTTKDGYRLSSSKAYLHRARNRPNLFVSKRSHVTKVLMDRQNRRAIGVEFIKGSKRFRVYVKKEVILSAGTIGSAQLLMLSGIGPADHLKSVGIKPLVDSPVGENLMDHIAYGGLVFALDQPVGINVRDYIKLNLPIISDYLRYQEGPFTVAGGSEALAFIDVDDPMSTNDYPSIELLFVSTSVGTTPIFADNLNLRKNYWNESYSDLNATYSWTIYPMLMRPRSRGRIVLRDKNPFSKPKIYSNYMSHPEDVRILVKGIRTAINISHTKAMQRFGSVLYPKTVPRCENFEYDSDDYWECAVRHFTMNIYHYSGTCKMGAEDDPTAVVNPKLQVIGVQGLRVADTSIMPTVITGHTNLPTFMIAEKLADIVKQDWGYPTDPLP